MLLGGTMVNMETWPNFTDARIEVFEKIEKQFIRRIIQAHSKTGSENLYLGSGIIPFKFKFMKRRILYYQQVQCVI